jgi:galactose-1-phosphate uridylyltransferase
MGKIDFVKEVINSEFLNPQKNFEKDFQTIERRKDPLTEEWCRINVNRPKRVVQAMKIRVKPDKKCFFCPENLEKSTPKFSTSLIPEGRIKVNEFVLFPNLFPFGKHHAVGVLTRKHSLQLHEISSKAWKDCFTGCIKFFKVINERDPKARFPSINFNYSQSAGASILHPHVQVLLDSFPSFIMDKYYRKSWEYFEKNKTNYWQDLIAQERNNERFVAENDSMVWLTSFAPVGNDEVIGVMKGNVSSFFELNEKQISDLSDGIVKIFKGLYEVKSVNSANMTIFSAPLDEHLGHFFSMNVKIISRPSEKIYTSDRGFCEILHKEPIISTIPEELAKELKMNYSD